MAIPGLGAVIGYAIGTVQVLLVDWWKRVGAHRRQLRLLQSELRRLATFDAKFADDDEWPPAIVPLPPRPTELFMKAVGEIEWSMTDEHLADDSQQAIFHLVDGLAQCALYAARTQELNQMAIKATEKDRSSLIDKAESSGKSYDAILDQVLFSIDCALLDVDRRLERCDFWAQLDRVTDGLPAGQRTRPFTPGSPEFLAWKQERETKRLEPAIVGHKADYQSSRRDS